MIAPERLTATRELGRMFGTPDGRKQLERNGLPTSGRFVAAASSDLLVDVLARVTREELETGSVVVVFMKNGQLEGIGFASETVRAGRDAGDPLPDGMTLGDLHGLFQLYSAPTAREPGVRRLMSSAKALSFS